MPLRVTAAALALLALVASGLPAPLPAQQDAVVVYLVRHAERAEDGTNDPPISEAGRERARALADLLRDAGVTRVHTTDLKRTRQTGAPLAGLLGLEPEVYDSKDLPALAARVRAAPGRHLVLGHSNTLAQTVEALGGKGGDAVADAEFDRLYVVVMGPDGTVTTSLLRYGAPWRP